MHRFNRLLIAYAVAIPLAVVLGYLAATPDMTSLAVVGMVLFVLILPLLIEHGHWLLILTWNSVFIAGFLPGQMQMWIIFAWLTFGMGMVHLVMGRRSFLSASELTKPILFLLTVVLVTAKIRGGLGLRILGSGSFGGKSYFFLLSAIIGYFALTSQAIPVSKRARTIKWFFLSGSSYGLSNLFYSLGPAFYILYFFVSSGSAIGQASSDFQEGVVKRFGGLGPVGTGLLCFILARWGIRGVLEWNKPWRLLLFVAAITAGLFSGFRSQFAFLVVLLAIQFVLEGLWKTAFLPALCLMGVLCVAPLLLFANKMPPAVQRTVSFLPVDIDPNVRMEAEGSTEWRFTIWRYALGEIPKYLLIGKGYSIDPYELYMSTPEGRMGLSEGVAGEDAYVAGQYHSGPLSVLIPFGIIGAIAFLWLLRAGIKALYANYNYGDVRLKQANTVLLSYFLTQCLFFFFVFGALDSGLPYFLGALGLSVSLNGGVCRRPAVVRQIPIRPARAAALPAGYMARTGT